MNNSLLLKIVLATFLLYTSNRLVAQENLTQLVCLKFNDYSLEKNKLIQAEFKNEKILFTCVPAGIVIIEPKPSKIDSNLSKVNSSSSKVNPRSIDKITEKLKRNYSFELVKDLTIEQAENTCSLFRNVENYK